MRARMIAAAVGVLSLAALVSPGVASAHLRTGTVAVGYGSTVTSPGSPAFTATIYRSDLAVHLAVRRGHTVAVLGYLGGAFLRIGPAGVAVDDASPTAAAVGLVAGSQTTKGWTVKPGSSATWHDTRVSQLRAGVTGARWTIPLQVDGRAVALTGVTRRLAVPALWPWLVLAGVCAAAAALLARFGDTGRTAIALGLLSAAAAGVAALGFAFDPYAAPGTWILAFDGLAFAAAGGWLALRGPANLRVGAGVGLGLLALALGLSKGEIFLRGGVLSELPATPSRALTTLAIAAGAAAAATGGLALVQIGKT